MLRRIIIFLLRLFGKGHWAPFLKTLSRQGRPSPVFFPPELIDQGISFALTGLTNTFAFQGHTSWALPWWAEQQLRPHSTSFIPAGVNVMTVNLTHRNWTSLGRAGARWKAMVDPCGMLTPKSFGHSWMPALSVQGPAGENTTWIPSRMEACRIDQHLGEGWQNRVLTNYSTLEHLEWRSEAMAFNHRGQDWIHWTHHLAWLGPEPLQLVFALGLRPYNALTLGPVFRSRVKTLDKALDNASVGGDRYLAWSVNRQPALLLGKEPGNLGFGKHRVDPLLEAHQEETLGEDASGEDGALGPHP